MAYGFNDDFANYEAQQSQRMIDNQAKAWELRNTEANTQDVIADTKTKLEALRKAKREEDAAQTKEAMHTAAIHRKMDEDSATHMAEWQKYGQGASAVLEKKNANLWRGYVADQQGKAKAAGDQEAMSIWGNSLDPKALGDLAKEVEIQKGWVLNNPTSMIQNNDEAIKQNRVEAGLNSRNADDNATSIKVAEINNRPKTNEMNALDLSNLAKNKIANYGLSSSKDFNEVSAPTIAAAVAQLGGKPVDLADADSLRTVSAMSEEIRRAAIQQIAANPEADIDIKALTLQYIKNKYQPTSEPGNGRQIVPTNNMVSDDSYNYNPYTQPTTPQEPLIGPNGINPNAAPNVAPAAVQGPPKRPAQAFASTEEGYDAVVKATGSPDPYRIVDEMSNSHFWKSTPSQYLVDKRNSYDKDVKSPNPARKARAIQEQQRIQQQIDKEAAFNKEYATHLIDNIFMSNVERENWLAADDATRKAIIQAGLNANKGK